MTILYLFRTFSVFHTALTWDLFQKNFHFSDTDFDLLPSLKSSKFWLFCALGSKQKCTMHVNARPGGELKPTEDHLEGLKRLLNDVCILLTELDLSFTLWWFALLHGSDALPVARGLHFVIWHAMYRTVTVQKTIKQARPMIIMCLANYYYFNKKCELMLTRRTKAYSSSGSVV